MEQEVYGFSTEEIEVAKNFLWDHLAEKSKEFIVKAQSFTEEERKKMYSTELVAYLEGDLNGGVITKEVARLYTVVKAVETPSVI